jgi:hypothetical protein
MQAPSQHGQPATLPSGITMRAGTPPLQLEADDVALLLDSLGGDSTPPSAGTGFRWAPCAYTLLPSDEDPWTPGTPADVPHVVTVKMDRNPPASTVGAPFRWHRNCVLPRIRVSVVAPGCRCPDGAAVLLSAVTVDVMSNAATNVGLDGTCLRPLVDGECSFSSLAFRTTSYNLPGRPELYLMASLLLRRDGATSPRDKFLIARSVISSGLTVDARKRQPPKATGSGGGLVAAGGPVEFPFEPLLLNEELRKACRDSSSAHRSVVIDNSIDGLRAYLTALNIRNKCKHPLFYVLRFDACIGLLYDASATPNPCEDDSAFFRMMEAVAERGPQLKGASSASSRAFAPFVLAVKGSHGLGVGGASHVCDQPECPVRLSSGLSLPHASSLPATYRMLTDREIGMLRKSYCRLHCTHGSGSRSLLSQHRPGTALALPAPALLCQPALPGGEIGGEVGSEGSLLCSSCDVQTDNTALADQRDAKVLLASVRHMVSKSLAAPGDGTPEQVCPEREWQGGLRILAEAMAQHCHTRSAEEIIAFMHDELVGNAKRPAREQEVSPKHEQGVAAAAAAPISQAVSSMPGRNHRTSASTGSLNLLGAGGASPFGASYPSASAPASVAWQPNWANSSAAVMPAVGAGLSVANGLANASPASPGSTDKMFTDLSAQMLLETAAYCG